jgi:hypothetical protein
MVTPPSTPTSNWAMGWVRTTELNRPFVLVGGQVDYTTAYNGVFLDDGFSLALLINEIPTEGVGTFAGTIIQAVCTSSASTC